MKRLIYLFLTVCVFGIFCAVTVWKEENTIPLKEKVVNNALEKTGLPGVISKWETTARREGHIHYVVRIPTEADDVTEHDEFVADINCINYEGERSVHTIFDQSVNSDQIEWENWKQQIVFTTLLYGGFENEEDVYRAFHEKEHPDGQSKFGWEAQLSEGYCKVFYSYRSNTTYDENGFPVENKSAFLDVAIYESYELYQKLKE